MAAAFDGAIAVLPEKIRRVLLDTEAGVKDIVREVRLRADRPIQLYAGGKDFFVGVNAVLKHRGKILSRDEIAECFSAVCGYSVHTHQQEISEGYVTVRGGHRVGICGSAVRGAEGVFGMRDITSLNIRVAREIKGSADELISVACKDGLCGIMIAGAAGCGKTTVVRDMARQLASARLGRYVKVTVVDERREIAAEGYDLGITCDVLSGFNKCEGITMAVRTLSPEVIICDEIGGRGEAEVLTAAVNNGASVIATAHAGSIQELYAREHIRALLGTGAFKKIVIMMGGGEVGRIDKIIDAER